MQNVVVLIPIYKPELDNYEKLGIDVTLSVLHNRKIFFIGSHALDINYYKVNYPNIEYINYPSIFFSSIKEYSRLLLSKNFYQQYQAWQFMLIMQTDAVVMRDELDYWCAQPFDYIGAPWPGGHELLINLGKFNLINGIKVHTRVGNGGLSLRRISKIIAILDEFPEIINYFLLSGSSEDLFFGFTGPLSNDFIMPNEITASRFSMELKPKLYFNINGNYLPMGGHAWWKYEPEFWLPHLKLISNNLSTNLLK